LRGREQRGNGGWRSLNDNGITDTEAAGSDEFCNGPGGPAGPGRGSQGNGLLLRNSDRNLISGNMFANNTKDGVFIDRKSTDNQLGGITAVNNGRLGINVQGTAITVSENQAFGNGWKAQCRGIVCTGK
jgi:parallel beta-helix repeat protein